MEGPFRRRRIHRTGGPAPTLLIDLNAKDIRGSAKIIPGKEIIDR
jgi:hypothetical protein